MTSYNREKPIKVLDSAGLEQDCIAVVDTLADSSWISRRRLYELGYSKNTSRRGKITKLGDGTLVRSQGTAQLSWRMSNGLLMRDHEFEMLPNNDIDIIFGDDIIRKYDLVVINWENLCPLVTAQEHETPEQRTAREEEERKQKEGERSSEARKSRQDQRRNEGRRQ